MAHVVVQCSRDATGVFDETELTLLSERLRPDGISYPAPLFASDGKLSVGVLNPTPVVPVVGANVCLGGLFCNAGKWWETDTALPDGSYALFRSSPVAVEIATDVVASRSVWYFHDRSRFYASSTQRGLTILLRSHELALESCAWLLGSGTLGTECGWDARIKRLEADSVLRLDRDRWELAVTTTEPVFSEAPAGAAELRASLEETLVGLDIDPDRWIVPLSGGYDSRSLLQVLSKHTRVRTATWGARDALHNPKSDAFVAARLAEHFATKHRYYELAPEDVDPELLFARYLAQGEGRTDHISGYMDGFAVWRTLYEDGCHGVVRGDEAFGSKPRKSVALVYADWNYLPLETFSNFRGLSADLGFPEVQPPERILRRPGETLSAYTERFYVQFYCGAILAGLNDLKAPFCEIINPLLSRRILSIVRRLPAALKADKALFKQIVAAGPPPIGVASENAIASKSEILRQPRVAEYLLEYLAAHKTTVAEPAGVDRIVKAARAALVERRQGSAAEFVVRTQRKFLRDVLKRPAAARLGPMLLALRLYIVLRAHEMLQEDARVLGRGRNGRSFENP